MDLLSVLEQAVGDCMRRIDSPNKQGDLSALSLKLQLFTRTFTAAKVYLQQDLLINRPSSSQAQKDALAGLLQVVNRSEVFFKNVHAHFIQLKRLRGVYEPFGETALRELARAGGGARDFGTKVEELHEHVQLALSVLRVLGSIVGKRRPAAGRLVDGDNALQSLVKFRKRPVRYGVDGEDTIRLHTLVAKTIWAAQMYGMKVSQTDAFVGANVLEQIEAWTALSGGGDDNTTDLGQQQLSNLPSTMQNGNIEDGSREISKNVVQQPSTTELRSLADLDQCTTGLKHVIQDEPDEILPGGKLNTHLISEAQSGPILPMIDSNTHFQDSLATSNQQAVEVPVVSATKTHTTKLAKSALSTHHRTSFKVWARKWYKPP